MSYYDAPNFDSDEERAEFEGWKADRQRQMQEVIDAKARLAKSPIGQDETPKAALARIHDRMRAEGSTQEDILAATFDTLTAAAAAGDQRVIVQQDQP